MEKTIFKSKSFDSIILGDFEIKTSKPNLFESVWLKFRDSFWCQKAKSGRKKFQSEDVETALSRISDVERSIILQIFETKIYNSSRNFAKFGPPIDPRVNEISVSNILKILSFFHQFSCKNTPKILSWKFSLRSLKQILPNFLKQKMWFFFDKKSNFFRHFFQFRDAPKFIIPVGFLPLRLWGSKL